MKKTLLLIISVFLFGGCATVAEMATGEEEEASELNYSYLALGDSYTIGEGVAEDERWPMQLVESLRERGYKVAPPKIIAQTGWTTKDLFDAVENELHYTRKFDLVSILIGVNNQFRGKSKREYEEELNEIFRVALNYSKRRERGVFALSIPDYSVTPYVTENAEEIREEIDEFNDIFRRVAAEHEVDFYNITPISREAARDPDLIVQDGLHPSGTMYRFWVQEIIEEITQKLPD